MRLIANQEGLALIVAVVMLLIFAVIAALMTSLVASDSDMALYQFRSSEATYVALAGQQYSMMQTYPAARVNPQVTIGSGGFIVDPPAALSGAITGATNPVPVVCYDKAAAVNCTTVFPATGRVMIQSELINYTGVTATSFTGVTRGVGRSLAAAHATGQGVYHATALTGAVTNAATTIPVTSTSGFMIPGTIKVDQEFLYCTGTTGGFSGCTRGTQGSAAVAHNSGATTIQVKIQVTGTVATGIAGNAQRILQAQTGVYLDGWAAGNTGTLLRWNGINWDTVTSPVAVNLNSTFLRDTNSDGAADDGWAVGVAGAGATQQPLILWWNGTTWATRNSSLGINENLNSIFCTASADCWTVGTAGAGATQRPLILWWNGATWATRNSSLGINENLNSIFCTASTDCWTVGTFGGVATQQPVILWWNGATWATRNSSLGISENLNSIFCASSTNCWTVGNSGGVATQQPLILWWNGATWATRNSSLGISQNLSSIYCVATNDCWAVGNAGTGATQRPLILWWNGATWATRNSSLNVNQDLNSVYCNSTNDCWAVGDAGTIFRWNGTSWAQYSSPTGNQLNEGFLVRPQNFVRLADWQEVY